jgi:predicted N-acetyltransferase YhbS
MEVRFGVLSDYAHLVEYDEFLGDRRLDLQAGELRVASIDEHQAVAYVRVAATLFLGWPLLTALCVHPDHRQRGLGLSLVTATLSDLRYPRLYASTELGNRPMLNLLGRVGARSIGHADELNLDGERELLFRLK